MLYASRLFDGHRFHDDCRVEHSEGRVTALEIGVPPQPADHVLGTGFLSPGLVDLQINGYAGVDFAAADVAELGQAMSTLALAGTTACLPTIITAPIDSLLHSLTRIGAATGGPGTRILGAHVEGPFIAERRKGAHREDLMTDPTPDAVERFLSDGVTAMMTLAPERAGAMDAIAQLTSHGIVASIGHTDATAAEVHEAAACGARMVTHLFNAQRPIGHREPGVPGAALVDPRLFLGLIADLHHVAPDMIRLAFAAAADRTVLVTDALASAGMPPGTYELGGESIVVSEPGQPARRVDGTLSGSGLTMAMAVRNCIELGIPAEHALRAATSNPAAVLRRSDVGTITPGGPADLVWFDDELEPMAIWIDGREITESA